MHVLYKLYKEHAPESAAGMGDEPDTAGALLNFAEQKVSIISTEVGNVESIFLYGATYVLQQHLEGDLGYAYSEVNGLRGHVQAKETVDMPALLALLDKFGFTYDEFDA